MEKNIKNLIINYLSYQDANVSEEEKEAMLAKGLDSESSKKYAISLNDIFEEYGSYDVQRLVQSLHYEFLNKIKFFEVLSAYGLSLSWVYWDIAKQYYFYKKPHLQQSPILYPPSNPMEDQGLQREIVLRQLGWEVYLERKNKKLLEKISNEKIVMEYIKKTPKENGQLSSWDCKNFGIPLSSVELGFKVNRKVEMSKFQEAPEWIPVQMLKPNK